MKKNIFGYILFILGNLFLLSSLIVFLKSDVDNDGFIGLILLLISITEIIFGTKLSLHKENK